MIKQFLVKLSDKSRVDELKDFGEIAYVSKFSSFICFNCDDSQLDLLSRHPLVKSVTEAPKALWI